MLHYFNAQSFQMGCESREAAMHAFYEIYIRSRVLEYQMITYLLRRLLETIAKLYNIHVFKITTKCS